MEGWDIDIETHLDSHLQESVLEQHASLTGMEVICRVVVQCVRQPSRIIVDSAGKKTE